MQSPNPASPPPQTEAPTGGAPGFGLIFLVLLVIAAGNTALQSVLPALGRQLHLRDISVALFFSLSALVWTFSAPYWARRSDREGRKHILLTGLIGFTVATALGAVIMLVGLRGMIPTAAFIAALALARAVFGLFGSATMPSAQAYVAARTSRVNRTDALAKLNSAFGLGTIIGPALAPFFVLPLLGLSGPLLVFAAVGLIVLILVRARLPSDHGMIDDLAATGAPASQPSVGGAPTGATAVAAAEGRGRLNWRDPRVKPFIIFGALSANAQAAASQTLGFLVIDRLHMAPEPAQRFIGIALMAGAVAALLVQWGLIQTFHLKPSALLRWGALASALGLAGVALAQDYHAIVVAFALANAGFGCTRPGFAAGCSLAVRPWEQGAVAGAVTAANGGAFILAPAIGIGLYEIDPHLPFVMSALVLAALFVYSALNRRLAVSGVDVSSARA
ncbi:MAG: MFS transporter [Sphingomonadaceae bacterium]|nr:MFS transporter [Sphingomonadaceae bacterium]